MMYLSAKEQEKIENEIKALTPKIDALLLEVEGKVKRLNTAGIQVWLAVVKYYGRTRS